MASRNLHKLFVGNLPWTVGTRELRQHFSQYGYVMTANVVFDKTKGMSKGFGFIQFGNRTAYDAALNHSPIFIEGSYVNVHQSMDDLEEYSPQVGELEATFNRAAGYLQSLASSLPSDKLLFFYARYKQVNEGPCNTSRPGFFDFKGKQKWDGWKALGDLSKDEAMKEYIEGIGDIDPDWQLKAPCEGGHPSGSWVKVSSLASPKGDAKLDEDKNHFDWVKENNVEKIDCVDVKTLSEKDENGMMSLHWAADRGFPQMIQKLVDKGIDIDTCDVDGQTALHYATSCGHGEVVKLLLANGADQTIVDSEGLLAVDCAEDDIKVLFN